MKGVIFTEFLGFIEQSFGLPMADHLITATKPESGGAYTSVGTYDSGELVAMVVELGKDCLLYTSPSPRDRQKSRMPSSA